MAGVLDLADLSEDFLSVCAAALDIIPDSDSTLAGAPERQIVYPGTPVWDCDEQLIVWNPNLGEFPTSRRKFARIPMVRLVALATRCAPKGSVVGRTYTPPSAASINACSRQHEADAWALYNYVYSRVVDGTLGQGMCDEVVWEGMDAVQPAGGVVGWQITARFQLDGFTAPAES